MKLIKKIALSAVLALSGLVAVAQDDAAKAPLFEYPVAPDTCTSLESRCNYIIPRFWDKCDLTKSITDDAKFYEAFCVYIDFFKYAHKNIVTSGIRDFMFKAQTNRYNFVKIGEMAEKALYSPEAEYWSDEVYVVFAQAMVDSKAVNNTARNHYKAQIERIRNYQVGSVLPDFEYTDVNGTKKRLSALTAEVIFIFFNDDSTDSSIARLRMSTDVSFNELIQDGKVAVLSISPVGYSKDWAEQARTYSDKWEIGANANILKDMDVRSVPSFYVLDKDRKIALKNIGIDQVKNLVN